MNTAYAIELTTGFGHVHPQSPSFYFKYYYSINLPNVFK